MATLFADDVRAQPFANDLRVLLADDDARCRGSLASLLSDEGFNTFDVGCGLEVIRQVEVVQPRLEDRIHFLVMDYNMPDLTGLEVLIRLRRDMGLTLPAILVSGEFSSDLEQTVLAAGGFALVPKPIQPIPFRQLVWELVRREFGI